MTEKRALIIVDTLNGPILDKDLHMRVKLSARIESPRQKGANYEKMCLKLILPGSDLICLVLIKMDLKGGRFRKDSLTFVPKSNTFWAKK